MKNLDKMVLVNDSFQLTMTTRGRVDMELQKTIFNLPELVVNFLTVVTHPDEIEDLRKLYKDNDIEVFNLIAIPHDDIGELRHKIIESAGRNVFFIDDSLSFHVRYKEDFDITTKFLLKKLSPKYFTEQHMEDYFIDGLMWVKEMFETKDFGIVGWSYRPSNNNLDTYNVLNSRTNAAWGVDYDYYQAVDADMSKYRSKQDLYLGLKFLTSGVPIIKNSTWASDRMGGNNSEGGCSLYRTKNVSEEDAVKLHGEFPQYITFVEKSLNSWKNYEGDTILDVRIQWKKAFSGNSRDYDSYLEQPAKS